MAENVSGSSWKSRSHSTTLQPVEIILVEGAITDDPIISSSEAAQRSTATIVTRKNPRARDEQ